MTPVYLKDAIHPFGLMFLALLIAWIYTIIPNYSVWVYVFIKQELWSIFGIALYAEFTLLCMPDISVNAYLSLYAAGIMLPMVIRIASYIGNHFDDEPIQLFSSIIGLPVVILLAGWHSFAHPKPADISYTESQQQPFYWKYIEVTHHTASQDDINPRYFDLFNSALTVAEDTELTKDKPEDLSNGRKLWREIHALDGREPSFSMSMQMMMSPSLAVNPIVFSSEVQQQQQQQQQTAMPMPRIYSGDAHSDSTSSIPPLSTSLTSQKTTHSSSLYLTMVEIIPRFYYIKHNISLGYVTGGNRRQFAFIALFFFAFNSYYYLLMYFVDLLRKDSDNTDFFLVAFRFLSFVLGASFFRFLLKRAGLALDRNKIGSTSIFFIAEFAGLMFFYSFYRILFESVDSWGMFASFQAIHLAFEWILYPLRASKWLYPYLIYIQDHPNLPIARNLFIPYQTNCQDWLEFIALDFGVRVVVMISSAVSMSILLLTVQTVSWVSSDLQGSLDRCWRAIVYIIVAALMEAGNAWIMNHLFFAKNRADVIQKTVQIFRDDRFAILSVIFAVNLLINPIYVFTKDNSYHYHP
eukprot:gene3446-3774_t